MTSERNTEPSVHLKTATGMPYIDLGEPGQTLHFSHANGYPPLCYKAMLAPLVSESRILAGSHRPLWGNQNQPDQLRSWQTFADDLVDFLDSHADKPVVGVGHSMGAVATLLAATQRPDLFKSLVLIEPVLVPRRYLVLLRIFSRIAPGKIPLVKKALGRTERWSSKQTAFDYLRKKRVFEHISDQTLWDYIEHGTQLENDGSCTLIYPKAWEAKCYTLVHSLWSILPHCQVPALAIKGANSNTVFSDAWQKWQNLAPQNTFIEIPDAGHLVPFERPDQVAREILKWIK